MQCANCGAEVREDVPFCTECGRPMQTGKRSKRPKAEKVEKPVKLKKEKTEKLPARADALPPEEQKPKPKKKRKWIWILVLVIAVALLIGAAYAYIAFPAFKMDRALGRANAEGYAKAAELYRDGVADSFLQTKIAERACVDELSKPADDYLADKLDYDAAAAFYGAFAKDTNKLAARAEELMKDVEAKHAVEIELGKGDEAFAAGDYARAMELYAQIAESSPGYETAQQRMADSRDKFVESVMSDVDKLVKSSEYAAALHALDDALAIVPDDKTLTARRDAFYEEFETLKREQEEAEAKEKEEKEADEEKDSKKTEKDDSEAAPAESPEPSKRPETNLD